jgi:capsular exopolysaccharide synthesis family protein
MNKIDVEFKELPYAVEEAMNRLRINIKFCGKNTKKILITSSVPNEGKSTISANLWKMMAEAGFPTVMVDVDLRKSVLKERHKMSGSGDVKDLGYYLSGLAEYEDVVYETNVENGYMVPCYNLLENPSALLEDARFKELLDRLAENYRYVIIDSPPLGSVADGALVASLCDGAVLVVRSGETSKNIIKQSFQQLEQVGCKLLGVILNRVEMSGRAYKSYYGKYGKNYGYGYGYGYYSHSSEEEGKKV